MRILLATSRLEFEAGSEIWTLTMMRALRDLGHSVDVFTVGRDSYSESPPDFTAAYDLAIMCHNSTVKALASRRIEKRIMVCHGILPDLEQPVAGADLYVAVSEETQAHLLRKGFDSFVIRNPIDCDRFNGDPPTSLRSAALMCSAAGTPLRGCAERTVRGACDRLGIRFVFLNNVRHSELPRVLLGVDVVIGAGRCILEAAACNRAVVSFDYGDRDRCGHGAIARNNFALFRRDSFTGRLGGRNFTQEEIASEILGAKGGLRDIIEMEHASPAIAMEFLRL